MAAHPEEIVFFGGYDPAYPRNAIIRKGLERLGIRIRSCRADGSRRAVFRYPALLARFFVSGCMNKAPLFVPDFRHKDVPLAWLLSRLPGRTLIFDPLVSRYETRVLDRGDTAEGSAQAMHNWNIDRMTMRMSDLVLADTDAHGEFYSREFGIREEKVSTLYLGYDDTVYTLQPWRARDEKFRVLFYGSFLPLHGTGVIAEAARLLDDGVSLTIVGGGQTMEEFRERSGGLGDRLKFLGNVPENDLPGIIGQSDVVLGIFGTTPKTGMVIPNKVYQSLACGRPVITADTAAVREIFKPGEHLRCVPPGDPDALAGAIEQLRSDAQKAARLAGSGGALVRAEFNPGKVARRLLGILGAEGEG